MLAASGIKNPLFYDDDIRLMYRIANETYVLPKILMKYFVSKEKISCESLFGLQKDTPICDIGLVLSKTEQINLISGCIDDEYTFTIPCIKGALEDLFSLYQTLDASNYHDQRYYSLEYWIDILVNMYIRSRGIDAELNVVSTHFGTIHKLGGMEEGIPYVAYGNLESYDEDGWCNPRDDDPEAFDEKAKAILGGSDKEFRVFTPQFGG
jgi:hypothetical protein